MPAIWVTERIPELSLEKEKGRGVLAHLVERLPEGELRER